MDMKKLLNIVSDKKESQQLNENVEECGMGGMSGMGSSMPDRPPVTMSVNLNANGIDNIKELINLMRSADSHDHSPSMGMPMPAVGMDMPIKVTKIGGDDMRPAGSDGDRGMDQIKDLIKNAGISKSFENEPEEAYAGIDSVTTDAGGGMQAPKDPADIRVKDPSGYEQAQEEYANEPDEQTMDHTTMIKDLSGGLNREKRQYAKSQDGDNAMAVREATIRQQLDAMWREIKEGRTDEWGINLTQPRSAIGKDVQDKYRDYANQKAVDDEYNAMIKKNQDEIAQLKADPDRASRPGAKALIAQLEKRIKDLEDERRHNSYGAYQDDIANALRKQAIANNELTPGQWLQKGTQYVKGKITGKEQPGVEYDRYDFSKQGEKGWKTPTPYKPEK